MKINKPTNKVMEVNGYKFIIENDEIKTVLDRNGQPTEYIDVETSCEMVIRSVEEMYQEAKN